MNRKQWSWSFLLTGGLLLSGVTSAQQATPAGAPVTQSAEQDKLFGFEAFSREETLTRAKHIGLKPVILPEEFEHAESIKASINELMISWLTKAGFEVTPPEQYQAIRDRMVRQVGGIYDPVTGAVRREAATAADSNAKREFVESAHLNALAIVKVIAVKASFTQANTAVWDQAIEDSRGRKPGNGFKEFWNISNSTGTLPAMSLLFGITTTEGKLLYVRQGGIQLSGYFDPGKTKGAKPFLMVPTEGLLRDQARLERAVRIVTQPLLYSSAQILAGNADPAINPKLFDLRQAPEPPAGVEEIGSRSALQVPREEILRSLHRVALAGLEIGKFQPDEATRQHFTDLITRELTGAGLQVVPVPDALKQFLAKVEASGGLFDPYTGETDEAKLSGIRKALVGGLGIDPAPDAIVWPVLRRTIASHSWGNATWDGTEQNAVTLGPVSRGWFGVPIGGVNGDGGVPAVSLAILIRDGADKLLYEGRGGIQVTSQLKADKSTIALAPAELFRDEQRNQTAVHLALRELTMDAASIEAEKHPPRKK